MNSILSELYQDKQCFLDLMVTLISQHITLTELPRALIALPH